MIILILVNAICLLQEKKFTEKEFIESEICNSYYAKRLINYQISKSKKWTCHHNFIKILNQGRSRFFQNRHIFNKLTFKMANWLKKRAKFRLNFQMAPSEKRCVSKTRWAGDSARPHLASCLPVVKLQVSYSSFEANMDLAFASFRRQPERGLQLLHKLAWICW